MSANKEANTSKGTSNAGKSNKIYKIYKMSQLLNTGLNDESVGICVNLIEAGLNPEAVADVVFQIRREVNDIRERKNAEEP